MGKGLILALNKTERAIVMLTALFGMFAIGFFIGRINSAGTVTVSMEQNAGIIMADESSIELDVLVVDDQDTTIVLDGLPVEPYAAPYNYGHDYPAQEPKLDDSSTQSLILSATPPTAIPIHPADAPVDAAPSATPDPAAAMPTQSPAAESPAAEAPADESHYADGKLRINLATQAELETLPGIGPAIAGRIIAYRDKNGSFKKLTTLKNIEGIGDKRYAAIKDLITVD